MLLNDKLPSRSTGDDPNIRPRVTRFRDLFHIQILPDLMTNLLNLVILIQPQNSAEIEAEQKAENSTKDNENSSLEQNMKNIRTSIISNDASLTCSSSQNEELSFKQNAIFSS